MDDAERSDKDELKLLWHSVFGRPGEKGLAHRVAENSDMIAKHIDSCEKRYAAQKRRHEEERKEEVVRRRWLIGLVAVAIGHLIAVWALFSKLT